MNAKKLFSTLVFALLLCTLLSVFALAAGDVYRVLFWDGTAIPAGYDNLFRPATPNYVTGTSSVSNFIHRTEVAKANLPSSNTETQIHFENNGRPGFINLYEYPYVQIKYRTNSPAMRLVLMSNQSGNNYGDAFIGTAEKVTPNAWNTLNLYFGEAGTYKGNTITKDNDTCGYPAENNAHPIWRLDVRFTVPSSANLSEDWYAEIEYINFFKTEEAMNTYDPYKLISFNGEGNINLSKIKDYGYGPAERVQSTANGTHRVEIPYNTPDVSGHSASYGFQILENDQFTLNDYPYAMIKYNTNFPAIAQFYFSKPGAEWSALLFGDDDPTKNDLGYYQLHFPKTTENSSTYRGNTVDLNSGAFPSDTYDATVWNIFYQLKALTPEQIAEIQANGENLYFEIEYMAFFKSEEDMDAFYAAGFAPETLGAQVRTDGTFGLRFGFTLDTAVAPEGCVVTEYGAVIGLDGTTPVVGNTDEYAVIRSTKEGFKSATEGTVISYNAVVTNIPDGTGEDEINHLATKLVARPYVTYTFGGYTYTTYGASVTKSVEDVRNASGWGK